MKPDSPIARVRKARCQISKECGHDPKRLVEYYIKLQEEKYADRLAKPLETDTKTKDEESP